MNKKSQKLKPIIIIPTSGLFLAAIILGLISPEKFLYVETLIVKFTMDWLAWLFGLVTMAMLGLCLYIGFSKKGEIILGGAEAKPLLSKWNWVAVTLCGGIGSGVVFWGVTEPLTHFASPIPNTGAAPFSELAAISSLGTVFYNWAIPYYVFYTICGIAVGYVCYNMKLDYTVSSTLYPVFGRKIKGLGGNIVDLVCLFGIAGGVSAVLGVISMQIASGLEVLSGLQATNIIRALILVLVVLAFMLSSYSGVARGIKSLSDLNAKIFLFFLAFVFLFGGTKFIISITWESLGYTLDNFFKTATYLSTINKNKWPQWWTVIYYSWAVGYGPMMGMFLGKIARGRSLREFVVVNLAIPAAFSVVWFGIFGGAAIKLELEGAGLWKEISARGAESSVFVFFKYFPLGSIFSLIFLLVAGLSVVTMCNSMTTTISSMTCEMGDDVGAEPPNKLKIFWALVMSLLAFINILSASTTGEISGIDATKQLVMATTGPLLILCLFQTYSVYKMMKNDTTYNIVEHPETASFEEDMLAKSMDIEEIN